MTRTTCGRGGGGDESGEGKVKQEREQQGRPRDDSTANRGQQRRNEETCCSICWKSNSQAPNRAHVNDTDHGGSGAAGSIEDTVVRGCVQGSNTGFPLDESDEIVTTVGHKGNSTCMLLDVHAGRKRWYSNCLMKNKARVGLL